MRVNVVGNHSFYRSINLSALFQGGAYIRPVINRPFRAGTHLVNSHPLTRARYEPLGLAGTGDNYGGASRRDSGNPVGAEALPLGTCGTLMK